ncbi:hypothetical protein V6N12_002871 [Hibiscus sabdariffa]|uniref:Uncharacterized protein n=1 Tax=Hibiscus sabdariffa TaxID=183260 RepID=A0ABR2EA91_9ROSI
MAENCEASMVHCWRIRIQEHEDGALLEDKIFGSDLKDSGSSPCNPTSSILHVKGKPQHKAKTTFDRIGMLRFRV